MSEITNDELLTMDDEDFDQVSRDYEYQETENTEEVVDEVAEEVVTQEEEPTVDEGSEEEIEESDSEETEEVEDTEEVTETEDDQPADSETEEEPAEEESPSTDDDTDEEEVEEKEFDYKTSYDEIMKPLKVSGKEVQVKSLEDARNLMSMGIDYSRKMRDFKPVKPLIATLEKAGLLVNGEVDEARFMRLLDIENGNKDAFAQIMKEKEIDPLDIEVDSVNYSPTETMVSEQSIEIQEVERELINRGSVDSVISELDKLDDRSKQFFNETPSNLLKLDDDIKSGLYEKIMGAVQYEKSLGRLQGMSDMEAYIQLATQEAPKQSIPTTPKQVVKKPSAEKRKAAGITSRAPVKKQVQKTYDYANMSDEEFEALANSDLQY